MSIISDRLHLLRTTIQKTRAEVAAAAHMSSRGLQYYESGERTPRISQLIQLADYYDVSLDYILGRTDDPTPPVPRDTPDAPGAPDEPG